MAELQLYKCRLKGGVHVGPDLTKEPVGGKHPEITVKRGGVYYAETDLAATEPGRWEAAGEKRARSTVSVVVGASLGAENGAEPDAKPDAPSDDVDELGQLTKAELMEHAERLGVSVDERMTKAQMIAAIKAGPQKSDDGE